MYLVSRGRKQKRTTPPCGQWRGNLLHGEKTISTFHLLPSLSLSCPFSFPSGFHSHHFLNLTSHFSQTDSLFPLYSNPPLDLLVHASTINRLRYSVLCTVPGCDCSTSNPPKRLKPPLDLEPLPSYFAFAQGVWTTSQEPRTSFWIWTATTLDILILIARS